MARFGRRFPKQPYIAPSSTAGVVRLGSTVYTSANTATVTTASYTPPDNCLLVAYCSMGNGLGSASSLGAVTDSLGGSWTRLAGEASASGGVAEIWARDVVTGAAMTVTYDPGGAGASGLDIFVEAFGRAAAVSGQPGATATNAGGTGYAVSITTTVTGSRVVGALGRASDAQTVTPNAATTLIGQVNGASGDTAALFRAAFNTSTPGATTLGFTNAPAGVNRIALVEIVPPGPAVNAPAESADATGSAFDASVAVAPNAESSTAAGAAYDATVPFVDGPPTVPTDLTAVAVRSTEADLTWTASTDDVGVSSYEIIVTRIQP